MSDEHKAQELISIFLCRKDNDIENFLKEKAITFEKLGKSRTFLVFDEDAEEPRILGYYTLALQVLKIPEEFSNRKIKVLDGFNAKINGEKVTELPTILIGQFAKNELYIDSGFSGDELMQYCLNTLLDGQQRLGGRIIMLECKDIPYLIKFYGNYGFTRLDRDYNEDEFIQLIRILKEEDYIESNSSN